jgi:hypothetical protein
MSFLHCHCPRLSFAAAPVVPAVPAMLNLGLAPQEEEGSPSTLLPLLLAWGLVVGVTPCWMVSYCSQL